MERTELVTRSNVKILWYAVHLNPNIKIEFQSIRSIIQPVQQLNILFMDYLVYLITIWLVLDYMGMRIDS